MQAHLCSQSWLACPHTNTILPYAPCVPGTHAESQHVLASELHNESSRLQQNHKVYPLPRHASQVRICRWIHSPSKSRTSGSHPPRTCVPGTHATCKRTSITSARLPFQIAHFYHLPLHTSRVASRAYGSWWIFSLLHASPARTQETRIRRHDKSELIRPASSKCSVL